MKYFILVIIVSYIFSVKVVAEESSQKLDCVVGASILEKSDFNATRYESSNDFFSKVAISSIEKIITSKPFDQNGVMFSLNLIPDRAPKLKGYFIVKERIEQVSLDDAICSVPQGNNVGFEFSCKVINPNDKQNLSLSFLYKYKLKMGVLDLKASEGQLSYLTKNKFSCLLGSSS